MVGAIPRGDYDLNRHTFCDASGVGYCANVYVVMSTIQAIQSRLPIAKCRLAPLKKLTIPRLELTSGRTGAKLVNTVAGISGKGCFSRSLSSPTPIFEFEMCAALAGIFYHLPYSNFIHVW